MPKVIGQDESVFKRCTCRHCGAINEYSPNEVRNIKTNYDYLGDYDLKNAIKCPGCKSYIFV